MSWLSSQYSVIGHALDQLHDEVRAGRSSVAPASRTRAMLGWSIRARAWRSASKRAMTWPVSMPGLMILSATLRRTGCSCSAMKTTPMPPSPICWSSLYGPIIVPGPSVRGRKLAVEALAAGLTSNTPPEASWAASKASMRSRTPGRRRSALQVSSALGPGRLLQNSGKQGFFSMVGRHGNSPETGIVLLFHAYSVAESYH